MRKNLFIEWLLEIYGELARSCFCSDAASLWMCMLWRGKIGCGLPLVYDEGSKDHISGERIIRTDRAVWQATFHSAPTC